jgi:hypothetical protein
MHDTFSYYSYTVPFVILAISVAARWLYGRWQ